MNETALSERSEARYAVLFEALAFFLRPKAILPEKAGWKTQASDLLLLLALNLTVLFLLLPLLIAWTHATGIEPPRMMRDVPAAAVLVLAVLVLPPLEEIVFRGWITGRPSALLMLAIGIALAVLLSHNHLKGLDQFAPALLLGGLATTLAGVWTLRKHGQAPQWFCRNFKWFFWGSTLLFASAHYSNYADLTAAHLPLVLPQLWSGLVFGFTRLRFGLQRSIALHCTSNALVLVAFYILGLPTA